MKIILSAALLLCCPAAAHAAPIVPPVGTPAGGYTLEASDSWTQLAARGSNMALPFDVANGVVRTPAGALQWGSRGCTSVTLPGVTPTGGSCTIVPGTIATWQARRFHPYRKTLPFLDVTLARFYAADTSEVIATAASDQVAVHPELDTPDCNATGDNEGWVVPWGSGPAGFGASPTAPDDFVLECGLPRAGDVAPVSPEPAVPVRTTAPVEAATCPAITFQRKRVAVTARGATCSSGRTIMARYLTRGIEPRGWVCVTAKLGRSKAATCAVPAQARTNRATPRVTAVWRA